MNLASLEYYDQISHPMLAPTGELPPCDPEIFAKGVYVASIYNGSARLIDRLITEVREASGERVDWHYVGGVGVVQTLGNVDKVRAALERFTLNINFGR